MNKAEAREEAIRRWGKHSLASVVNDTRYIVADGTGVRGASNVSFEKAFQQAEGLGQRKTVPKDQPCQ